MADDEPAPTTDDEIERTIFALLRQRDAAASICPSDVARALASEAPAWRALMPDVRRVAAVLAERGSLRVTRGADEVDAMSPGGPIRLRRPK
jgi:hypothetical protein